MPHSVITCATPSLLSPSPDQSHSTRHWDQTQNAPLLAPVTAIAGHAGSRRAKPLADPAKKKQPFLGEWEMTFVTFNIACVRHGARRVLLVQLRLPFAIQMVKAIPTHHHLELGLKTLNFSEAARNPQNLDHHHPHIIHNHKVSPAPSSSSSSRSSSLTSCMLDSSLSWSSFAMDDLIGTDSGVQIMLTEEQEKLGFLKNTVEFSMSRRNEAKSTRSTTTQRSEKIKKEYPPPIPLLAQTGNLRGCMPWILTKHYDHSNGRLVLKGERVKHHEYFEAHREDGRLILNLVPLDNALACFDSALTCCDEENEEELEMDKDLQSVDEENGDGEEDDDDGCNQNKVNETHQDVEKKAMDVISGYNSVSQSQLKMSIFERYRIRSLPNLKNAGENNMVEFGSTSFCDVAQNIHEHPQSCLGHPASAPLRSMTPVM
ncbi:hypothetical protein ACE6H2_005078 [Prunus campanulata]